MMVIFTVYILSRIIKKRELSENIYNAKTSTFTVDVATCIVPFGYSGQKIDGLTVPILQPVLISPSLRTALDIPVGIILAGPTDCGIGARILGYRKIPIISHGL